LAARTRRSRLVLIGVPDEDLDLLTRIPGAAGLEFIRIGDYEAATDPLRCDPDAFVADVLAQVRADPQGFDGILQLDDYPSSMLMPLIARELGLPSVASTSSGAGSFSAGKCRGRFRGSRQSRSIIPHL
jgi:hypothetical protein